jgi:uncharacterized protein
VNFVGVDINTASAPLLSYISGIGPALAEKIVKTREEKGGIRTREELKSVSRFSEKIFEQSAGFIRVYNGENPLDTTSIHPEKYPILEKWSKGEGIEIKELITNTKLVDKLSQDTKLKDELGEFTHQDIIKSLKAPKQDPRTEFKSTEFRKDIKKIGDLEEGQWYTGIVTNIAQFGAFVDIGIKENGLVHVSQIADHFVDNALDALKVGQEIKARVMDVDLERGRISLSLKQDDGQARVSSPNYCTKGKNKPKTT